MAARQGVFTFATNHDRSFIVVSRTLFPIYEFNPNNAGNPLQSKNLSMILIFLAFAFAMMWAMAATSVTTYVKSGMAIMYIVCVCFIWNVINQTHDAGTKLGIAWAEMERSKAIILLTLTLTLTLILHWDGDRRRT